MSVVPVIPDHQARNGAFPQTLRLRAQLSWISKSNSPNVISRPVIDEISWERKKRVFLETWWNKTGGTFWTNVGNFSSF